jgi:hypothetical protein
MPYVMMPVPEEHVEEVMQFILRAIAKASIEPWDADSINAVYTDVDEASRSLLAFVARAAVDGRELIDADAARKIQMTVRETAGIMNELNILTRDSNRPALINVRVASERQPNGRVTERRVLQMDADVADFVRAAEQAEIGGATDPLAGAPE